MIPTKVRAAISQRVAKLPEGTRTILQLASVLGAWFSFDDLKEMSNWNDDALEAALENAADSGLVHAVERDQYSFNHVMIGKALYAEIQDHRRRRLHLAAAELMERTGARHAVNLSAEVAHHLLEGGALKRALPWFIRAGENAETVYAHPEAEQLLRTAVKLARDLNDRTLLTEAEAKLEEILATVACDDEAVTQLETAVDTSLVEPRILIISGLPGAGKSTTARLLASQMCRGAHVEADKLQELIVAGGIWPDGSPNPTAEAQRQLRLRLHHACLLARSFANHGFSAIIDDIVIGERLEQAIEEIAGTPFGFVMLLPDFELVRERWKALGSPFVDKWQWIDDEIRTGTRRVGLWLDTTSFTPEKTVQEIIRRFDETVVSLP
jgi:chloramphenicol 3-O-phosphotransferase